MSFQPHAHLLPAALDDLPRIVSARNDLLIDAVGHRLIDLFSANGAAFLGHAHPRIAQALKQQLDAVWLTGGLPTDAGDAARQALEARLPSGLRLAGLYTTGMEAAEFAMRMARVHTGRPSFVGFDRSMHGKSLATAALGWANAPTVPIVHRLPSFADQPPAQVLQQLEDCLRQHPVAAVFLEPILGSGGGHVAPEGWCAELIALCHSHGALVVADEILCGVHRTGPFLAHAPMRADCAGPDLLLLGKGLGNGFPVAAVAARADIACTAAMLPGSTYAGNPLAARAVAATLAELPAVDAQARVAAIAEAVQGALTGVGGVVLRGRGALWMLEVASAPRAQSLARRLYRQGVFVSCTAQYLRILPAATIAPAHLAQALAAVREAVCAPAQD
jgi:acetylornithine/succinyldiaminopimelate/putrescine aminotransferase